MIPVLRLPLLRWLALLPMTTLALSAAAPGPDFHDHLGMQLWSLRSRMKDSETAALDLAQITGIREVETAGTGKLTAEQFVQELRARNLEPIAAHVGYALLKKDVQAVIRDARVLGVKFVICPSLPHSEKGFSAEDAKQAAAEFNAWGEACRAAGLRFGYHPHGFEFAAIPGSTDVVFDVLMRETKPELVCYEMDVFWVAHAGQDPVQLLAKYPDRWRLLHVKDMRKGTSTGHTTGKAQPSDNVAVGQGQLDWPAILRQAQKIGVEHYFLEDETATPLQCIPQSLEYLRRLKL